MTTPCEVYPLPLPLVLSTDRPHLDRTIALDKRLLVLGIDNTTEHIAPHSPDTGVSEGRATDAVVASEQPLVSDRNLAESTIRRFFGVRLRVTQKRPSMISGPRRGLLT